MLDGVASAVWKRAGAPLRRRVLWLWEAKFITGISVAVLNEEGRVLLLRHRYWPGCAWGLPSGHLKRGETIEEGIARELHEEVGLDIHQVEVAWIRSGVDLRLEVYCTAELLGADTPRPDGREVLDAAWFTPGDLPEGLMEQHRCLIRRATTS